MKLRALLIILAMILALLPFSYVYRWLQKVMRPRESPGQLVLFFFANFVLIIVYTILLVGVVVRLFGR